MKIGLALSGGGFRATVFHLGVLARLAIDEHDLFRQVTHLSTVSGGSLCVGLIYALSGFKWPSEKDYLKIVLPEARRILTTRGLVGGIVREALQHPWTIFQTHADDLSRSMRKDWGITARLKDIPVTPHWAINSCCYETAKSFRFEPNEWQGYGKGDYILGDYVFGYALANDFLLSDAMAASAGFPVLIGFMELDPRKHEWKRKSEFKKDCDKIKKIHLWDGGAYDNQGFEALVDVQKGWRHNDFLLASDASDKPHVEAYKGSILSLKRLVTGIMMEQVGELRSRIFFKYSNKGEMGSFFQIGDTCEYVLHEAKCGQEDIDKFTKRCLKKEQAEDAAHTPTWIDKLSPWKYDHLFRHGYEVADYTLYAYHPKPDAKPCQFKFLGYDALKPYIHWREQI